jgi:hypothetical protein
MDQKILDKFKSDKLDQINKQMNVFRTKMDDYITKREVEIMNYKMANEMLSRYSFDELIEHALADAEFDESDCYGCLLALSILQIANGDKNIASKMLREDTAIVEAYYGQKMDVELLRFKALSEIKDEIEGKLKC